MLELGYKESWAPKNWSFWTVCWRRLLRVPWTSRRSNQSILKEIIGRTDVEAETPILWPPGAKTWLIWKDPDAGKDWRWEKGTQRMRWHHQLPEFTQTHVHWVGDAFSSCFQSFPALGSFQMSQVFTSGGQSTVVQLQWTPRTDRL